MGARGQRPASRTPEAEHLFWPKTPKVGTGTGAPDPPPSGLFWRNSLSKGDFSRFARKKHRGPHFWGKSGVSPGCLRHPGVFSLREKTKKDDCKAIAVYRPLFSAQAPKKVYGLNFLAVWGRNLFFLRLRGGQKPLFLGRRKSAFLKKGRLTRVLFGVFYFGPRLRSGRLKRDDWRLVWLGPRSRPLGPRLGHGWARIRAPKVR